ncbi:MAG: lipoate--protein ligase [Clostridiales bacterium]|nr:lipoate--protein ligase [Clostridiales bacterium]
MKLKFLNTYKTEPHHNLALEEYLFTIMAEDDCILYLWQNKSTVVIGKNQNAYKECKVDTLEKSGGSLARRPSGGGAVYHDLGNLNFTFLARGKNYNVEKQLEVIIYALSFFGLRAERTGRNDICVDGRKFSGNAFLKRGDRHYHHGTILVDVDMAGLSQFLNVSPKKLQAKGVASVKSRVVNLSELKPEITVEAMRSALKKAFEQVYKSSCEEIYEDDFDGRAIDELEEKYRSAKWLFPEKAKATFLMEERFNWGEISIGLELSGDRVKSASVYTDAMETELAPMLEEILQGCRFAKDELAGRLFAVSEDYKTIAEDLRQLILSQDL